MTLLALSNPSYACISTQLLLAQNLCLCENDAKEFHLRDLF